MLYFCLGVDQSWNCCQCSAAAGSKAQFTLTPVVLSSYSNLEKPPGRVMKILRFFRFSWSITTATQATKN